MSIVNDLYRSGRITAEQAAMLMQLRREVSYRRWRRDHPFQFALAVLVRAVFG